MINDCRVYDVSMFLNEYDLLDIKMHVEEKYVDKFVINDSPWTHSGKPKALFDINLISEELWDKIIIQLLPLNRPHRDPEANHIAQRSMWTIPVNSNDIIIISDLDEITRPEAIEEFVEKGYEYAGLELDIRGGFVNLHCDYAGPWHGSVICRAKCLQNKTLNDLRYVHHHHYYPISLISNAGWHFSYMGGAERVHEKLVSSVEVSLDTPQYTDLDIIKRKLETHENVLDGHIVPINNEGLPQYLVDNREKFGHLFYEEQVV